MLGTRKLICAQGVLLLSHACFGYADSDVNRPETSLKLGRPISKLQTLEDKSKTFAAGDFRRDIEVGNRDRFYEVHVPASYQPQRAMPLVLVFHGGGGNPTAIRWQTRMDSVADTSGFIVAYPAGTGLFDSFALTFNAHGCCGYAQRRNVDDVEFTSRLLDDLGKFFNIDSKRVYATGYSNGAQFSYLLACQLSNRIAAVAANAAPMTSKTCFPQRAVPVLHFHGTEDPAVPIAGGKGNKDVAVTGFQHMPVQENIDFWVANNSCKTQPSRQWTVGSADFSEYSDCRDGANVVLCRIRGGGHSWPGGRYGSQKEDRKLGAINQDISASELIWDFFSRYRLP